MERSLSLEDLTAPVLVAETSTEDSDVPLLKTRRRRTKKKRKETTPTTIKEKNVSTNTDLSSPVIDSPQDVSTQTIGAVSSDRTSVSETDDADEEDSTDSGEELPHGGYSDIRGARVSEWYLNCSVDDITLRAVIDSGATTSTMNLPTFRSLKPRYKLEPSGIRVHGVSGQVLKVHGTVTLPIRIADNVYHVSFVVLDSPEKMLLGADFLSVNDVKMDFGSGTARIGHAELVLHVKGCKKAVALSNNEQVTIPLNSEVVLRLACKRKGNKLFQFNLPIVLEPTKKLVESGAVLAQTLTTMKNPYALLLNPTDEEIHIPPIRRVVIAHSASEVLNNDNMSGIYGAENIRLYSDSDNDVPKDA